MGSSATPATVLDYSTARTISALPEIVELNIGHFLVGEAIFVGLAASVRAMRAAMDEGRGLRDHRDRQRSLRHQADRGDARPVRRPFLDRCFTEIERRRSDRRAGRAASYAKRFAAKEACAKALGTGLRRGVFWRDMGVVNLPSGPADDAADRRRRGAPCGDHAAGTLAFIHLTITDEAPIAAAFVVIEARPIA